MKRNRIDMSEKNESAVRGKDDFDAMADPPPGLAVEVDVDVTSMSTIRMPIYASFGVPEVWRWIDEELEVYHLKDSEYLRVRESQSLPGFPFEIAISNLLNRHESDETSLVIAFRAAISAVRG